MKNKVSLALFVSGASVLAMVSYLLFLSRKEANLARKNKNTYQRYYELTNQWVMNKNLGKGVTEFFIKHKHKKIAIYGVGTLAELLYEELKDSDIEIVYYIDKNAFAMPVGYGGVTCVGIEDIGDQKEVDVIVVTPVNYFDEIAEELEDAGIEILSLEDVVFEL